MPNLVHHVHGKKRVRVARTWPANRMLTVPTTPAERPAAAAMASSR